jgi:hypothetical protein
MVHNEKSALADGNAYGSQQDAGYTSIFFSTAFRVKTFKLRPTLTQSLMSTERGTLIAS